MAQFDVYENINKATSKEIPYLLDIQHNVLSDISTRVVIPLAINKKFQHIISPKFNINQTTVIMLTTHITSMHLSQLETKICSFEDKRAEIINAIDFLVTGF